MIAGQGQCHFTARFVIALAVQSCCGHAEPGLELVRGVYLELCVGKSIPLEWSAGVSEYSLAIPRDAPFAGVRVAIGRGETPEEEFAGTLALRVPLRSLAFTLEPGLPSEMVSIDSNFSTVLKIDIATAEFTVNVIRALIASNGQGETPDPARQYPPPGTLSGLALWDSMGQSAHMAWFTPRTSMYYASIQAQALDVRLVATPNDPGAELEWRRNGGKWDFLVSGLTSAPARCSENGWTLLEVRVRSTAALATGHISEPLVYQIAITKELVCHPKCRTCGGPRFDQCTSCFAPLILHSGKCLYTSCRAAATYFDPMPEQCLPCSATCAECTDGSSGGCTSCPAGRFLLTASAIDVAGECVVACPFGYYVQPLSQRCQRAPASSIASQSFYIRLVLRISVDEFQQEQDLLQQILQVAAELLRVSPQDVRFHQWDEANFFGVYYYFEVANPFLKLDEVDERFTIDQWFGAMPVPVDKVSALSQSEMHPPPLAEKPEPLLPPWAWAAMIGGLAGLAIICPLYHFYFIRKHWELTPYRPDTFGQPQFVEHILKEAPDKVINLVAVKDRGAAG